MIIPPEIVPGITNSITIKGVNNIPRLDEDGNAIPGESVRAAVTSIGTNAAGYTVSAEISIDMLMTNYDAILETVSHEIGHPGGFGDCDDCAEGESIMAGVPYSATDKSTFNQSYGRYTSPTCCDKKKLKHSYETSQPSGGGGNPPNDPPYQYYCTPYYWVYYLSWDEGQSWEIVDVQYAGCW